MTEQDKPKGFSGDHHPPPPQPQPFPAPQYSTTDPPPSATDPSAPVGERRLCCGGLGCGWCLFISGFFLIIPWYVGAIMMLYSKVDYREKRGGYIACIVAAVVITIGIVLQETVLRARGGYRLFYFGGL